MRTLKISNNDLIFNETGNLEMVEDIDEKLQSIERILTTNTNEWFLNIFHGLNYNEIQGKGKDIESIRLAIIEAVYQDPRVTNIDYINIHIDTIHRYLTVNFNFLMDGETIQGDEVVQIG